MKEKVEALLNNPDVTNLEIQHIYQELSCIEVIKRLINSHELNDRMDVIWRLEELLDEIRIEVYKEMDKEETCL